MEWIYCFIDMVCFFYNRGLFYGNIKFFIVLFISENYIFFLDLFGYIGLDRNLFDKELYDYVVLE